MFAFSQLPGHIHYDKNLSSRGRLKNARSSVSGRLRCHLYRLRLQTPCSHCCRPADADFQMAHRVLCLQCSVLSGGLSHVPCFLLTTNLPYGVHRKPPLWAVISFYLFLKRSRKWGRGALSLILGSRSPRLALSKQRYQCHHCCFLGKPCCDGTSSCAGGVATSVSPLRLPSSENRPLMTDPCIHTDRTGSGDSINPRMASSSRKDSRVTRHPGQPGKGKVRCTGSRV